jgi:hypothetical protein
MAYQRPSNPAPVSGPGALSQRTDGGPSQPIRVASGGDYGDRTDMIDLQSSAPMEGSAAPSSPPMMAAPQQPMGPMPTPLTDPSQRPDEPGTHGAASGPGAGPEILGLGQQLQKDTAAMKALLPVIEQAANRDPDFTSMRLFVQYLKGM